MGEFKIKILIVDDSPVASQMLTYIFSSDPECMVIGVAINGEEAIRLTTKLRPDIITMDINMPIMNGFEATRQIMETMPVPIVIVSSSYDPKEVASSFCAMEAGALSIMAKPVGIGHPLYEEQARHLVNMVKALSEVAVVTRRKETKATLTDMEKLHPYRKIDLIAMGASTGGPPVLQDILSQFPKDFSLPVMIVQHIANGFGAGFATWLANVSGLNVRMPENGESSQPGIVYLAPDNVHMTMDTAGRILLNNAPPNNGSKPSVAHLFRSVASSCRDRAVGVLLTGMGKDGAAELKMMRDAGAITFAQDKESCAVFGMPGEAVKLGGAKHILPPRQIAVQLVWLMEKNT